MTLGARCVTPSQTVGPFFHLGLCALSGLDPAGDGPARRITIRGTVRDGAGAAVGDALLETWQADADGRYPSGDDDSRRTGFGRVATNDAGQFEICTVMPGAVPGPAGTTQAPHLLVAIFMRGLLRHLVTRIYFQDEPANAIDPILSLVDDSRRDTLVATRVPGQYDTFAWNVQLQGPRETAFFDV